MSMASRAAADGRRVQRRPRHVGLRGCVCVCVCVYVCVRVCVRFVCGVGCESCVWALCVGVVCACCVCMCVCASVGVLCVYVRVCECGRVVCGCVRVCVYACAWLRVFCLSAYLSGKASIQNISLDRISFLSSQTRADPRIRIPHFEHASPTGKFKVSQFISSSSSDEEEDKDEDKERREKKKRKEEIRKEKKRKKALSWRNERE
jgi:hypothetical protein